MHRTRRNRWLSSLSIRISIAPDRSGTVFVAGIDPGVQYGYRFDMQPNPDPQVYRYDPRHVLLDPYARVLSNGGAWGQYKPGTRPYRNGVVVENHFDWEQ